MKRTIKAYLKYGIFLLGILLLLPQCQKDDVDVHTEISLEKKVKRISLENLTSKIGNTAGYRDLSTIFDVNKKKNASSQKELSATSDVWLNTDEIVMIQGNGITFYTFVLETNESGNQYYNLVTAVDDQGTIESMQILEYTPSSSWLTNTSEPFTGSMKLIQNTFFTTVDIANLLQAESTGGCVIGLDYQWDCNAGEEHAPNTCLAGGSDLIVFPVYGDCPETLDSGGSGGGGNDSSYPINPSNGGGNNGSSIPYDNTIATTPIVKYEAILNIDGLSLQMTEWLNNNPSIKEELENFLDENNWSIQAKEEVKLTIQAGSIKESDWDYTRTGSFHGQSSLDYVAAYDGFDTGAYTMYKLANGHTLCESTIRRVINPEDANTTGNQNNPTSNFYYVQINELQDTDATDDLTVQGRWYNYKVPPNVNTTECIVCGLEYLFQAAITNTLVFTGRYVIPVEDALILITGEDFDGVESSRAVSGSFIVLEIVGVQKIYKLLKAIKHVDEVIEVAQAVFRYMDDVFKAQKRYVDDVLNGRLNLDEFGNTTRKGNYGEMYTDVELTALGYEPLHTRITNIDQPLNHGIDGVYRNPNTGEYLIVESKYNTSQLGNTLDGKQMSDSWINGTTTGNSRLVAEVGEELAQEIVISGYKRVVSRILPNGTNYFQLLDSNGNIIEIWFP